MAQGVHDLVVRGGLVADGRGGEPRVADVAVDGGTIAAVGTVPGRGAEEIDAEGLLVTPGFVDIHTHYDGQATWDDRMTPSSWHGVTTAVMGNCGVGFAPVRPDAHPRLISLMEGVEDIPGAVLDEGIDWSWESFGDYLAAVEQRPHDIDLCAQLPHGALRLYVMGERAARLEEATPEDIAAMRRLATEALRDGAIGFSTSRTLNHRTASGDPTPSLRASTDELEAIALGVADAGHGVVELISDFWPDTDGEFELVRTMVARTGVPLSLSLAQSHRHPEAWRDLLDRIDAAVAEGLPIRAQVAPRPVGLLVGLQSSYHPLLTFPAYAEHGGTPRRRAGARTAGPGVPGPAPRRHGGGGRRRRAASAPAPRPRLRAPLPAGRRPRLRAPARDERAAAGRVAGCRSGRVAAGPAVGERRTRLPLHAVLQLCRREPRCLRRNARPPPHRVRPRRRRGSRRPHFRCQLPDVRALALGPRPRPRPHGGGPGRGAIDQRHGPRRRASSTGASSPQACGRT